MSFRMKRMREFFVRLFRPSRKKIIFAAIAAVLLVVVAAFALFFGQQPAQSAGGVEQRTVTLSQSTLSESITVTGTVESDSVANVTTHLTYPVAEIPVQVGDAVNEGDIICVLDTSDLEDELAKQQESLSDSAQHRCGCSEFSGPERNLFCKVLRKQ